MTASALSAHERAGSRWSIPGSTSMYARANVPLRVASAANRVTTRCFAGGHEDRHPSARVNLRSGGFVCRDFGAKDGAVAALELLGFDRRCAVEFARDYGVLDPEWAVCAAEGLQLAAVHQLDEGNGYSSGFAGVLVGEPAAKSGQHSREIIVEGGCCALAEGCSVEALGWRKRARRRNRSALPTTAPRTGGHDRGGLAPAGGHQASRAQDRALRVFSRPAFSVPGS